MFDDEFKAHLENRFLKRVAAGIILRAVEDLRLIRSGEKVKKRTGGWWLGVSPYPFYEYSSHPDRELEEFFQSETFTFYSSFLDTYVSAKAIYETEYTKEIRVESIRDES